MRAAFAGVGKTALARAVARGLHGEDYEERGKLFVVDMSNHADSHTVRARAWLLRPRLKVLEASALLLRGSGAVTHDGGGRSGTR